MSMTVWARTTMEGLHRWKGAKGDVAFLANEHRHVFHVVVGIRVDNDDRAVEFISLGRAVTSFLSEHYPYGTDVGSCEAIARHLGGHFNAEYVTVSEDGENGATWRRGP